MNKIENLTNKKVLVTGAAGFIASHLTEMLLQKGAKVTAFVKYNSTSSIGWLEEISDKENLTIIHGDVRDPFQINSAVKDIDIIFHLAALIGIPYSYAAPQSYVETNLLGTMNILEAAKSHKTSKIILTSTSEVYGTAITVPIKEDHPLQAQSPYSATKIAADMMGKAYACSFGLPVTIVRPFNTFGPRQSLRAVIPTIITQALKGKIIKLGDTKPVRDFNYVLNTCEGFIAAALNGNSNAEIYNLASCEEHTIGETAQLIADIMGAKLEIQHDSLRDRPADSEVMRLLGDYSKAEKELGWKPHYSFKEGLTQTINWFEKNIDKYKDIGNYKS